MRKITNSIVLLLTPVLLLAYSSGPPDQYSNNPPNFSNCTACHSSFVVNSGDGSFFIEGLPEEYNPGQTYTITVQLEDPGQLRWGFLLTAQLENLNEGGTLAVVDPVNTQISLQAGSANDYIKQTRTGTYAGTAGASPGWEFEWTAPLVGSGDVTFYASGNAANANNSTSGDYIYTLQVSIPEFIAPPEAIEDLVISIEGDNVTVSWSEVTGATVYNIYRSTDPYFAIGGAPYATVPTAGFADTGAVSGTAYFYIVTAEN